MLLVVFYFNAVTKRTNNVNNVNDNNTTLKTRGKQVEIYKYFNANFKYPAPILVQV